MAGSRSSRQVVCPACAGGLTRSLRKSRWARLVSGWRLPARAGGAATTMEKPRARARARGRARAGTRARRGIGDLQARGSGGGRGYPLISMLNRFMGRSSEVSTGPTGGAARWTTGSSLRQAHGRSRAKSTAPGPPRRGPTIVDVARRAGVSKGAVSFALNDRPGVAPETRDRILAAASDLGWQPSTRARALSRSRAFAVGLVMRRAPELLGADPFFPQFLAGVESVLAERGSALVLQVVGDDDEAEAASYRRLAGQGRVDGVFLNDMLVDDHRFGLLAGLGLPAVAVGRPTGPCPFPVVTVDDRQGVAGTVEHL